MVNEIMPNKSLSGFNKELWKKNTGLKKACTEFESIFITHMLKAMDKTIDKGGLLGNSNENKMIKSMFNERLGNSIARSGGIGIGEILFEKLKN
ncbi:MAG: rod-binding protein [Thermodesulfobacteriota bacterium]|nr:rod-binding protein [Thermodesulfobacteriota bacterium]